MSQAADQTSAVSMHVLAIARSCISNDAQRGSITRSIACCNGKPRALLCST